MRGHPRRGIVVPHLVPCDAPSVGLAATLPPHPLCRLRSHGTWRRHCCNRDATQLTSTEPPSPRFELRHSARRSRSGIMCCMAVRLVVGSMVLAVDRAHIRRNDASRAYRLMVYTMSAIPAGGYTGMRTVVGCQPSRSYQPRARWLPSSTDSIAMRNLCLRRCPMAAS